MQLPAQSPTGAFCPDNIGQNRVVVCVIMASWYRKTGSEDIASGSVMALIRVAVYAAYTRRSLLHDLSLARSLTCSSIAAHSQTESTLLKNSIALVEQ